MSRRNETIVFDKAKWHTEGDSPKGLPKKQACVHIGWMLGWLVGHDLISDEFKEDFPEAIETFRKRQITGPRLAEIAGEGLVSDMVTPEAKEFLREYYENDESNHLYYDDLERLFKRGLPTSYHQEYAKLEYGRLLWRNPKMRERLPRHPHAKRFAEHEADVRRVLESPKGSDGELDASCASAT